MTNLEAIQTMKSFLLKQGGQAVSGSGECKFRGVGNQKCAVGCLIPDDVYHSSMECMGMYDIKREVEALYGLSVRVLHDAQSIHDDWNGKANWNDHINKGFDSLEARYCH